MGIWPSRGTKPWDTPLKSYIDDVDSALDVKIDAETERATTAEIDLQASIDAIEASDVDSVAGLSGTVSTAGLKTALSLPADAAADITSLDGRLDTTEGTLGGRLSDETLADTYAGRSIRTKHVPAFGLYFPEAEGAVCDGVADDADALIATITACHTGGGGTVLIDGILQVNPAASIEVPEGVRLQATVEGRWENYATLVAGSTIRLKSGSALTSSDSVLKFVYTGVYPDHRHTGGAFGITVHGNKDAGNDAQGVVLSGVRFVHLERVYSIRNGSHGFASETNVTATSEMYFTNTFAGWNGGQGYRLFGGDSTITGAMAGSNTSDGFYLGLAATVCTGLSAWNNGRDGAAIAATVATEYLSICGGQFYDNDRAGITVEALNPGSGINMIGNAIVGASCHGNGRQEHSSDVGWQGPYPSATDRVGIRVLGAHTTQTLAIQNVKTGNRSAYTKPVTSTTINSGSAVITSTSALFEPSDAGEGISGRGIPNGTTVLSYDSPTQVTLSANATLTNSNQTVNINPIQQYGVALQTANCVPAISGITGGDGTEACGNAILLFFLTDATAVPEAQLGRVVPARDNLFALGRVLLRWFNVIAMRFEVYSANSDSQPRVRLGSTTGGAELSLGAGGSTATDWRISRTGTDTAKLDAGDHFGLDGAWNGGRLLLGSYQLWVDASGRLRIKSSAPSSDTDGTIVGVQS